VDDRIFVIVGAVGIDVFHLHHNYKLQDRVNLESGKISYDARKRKIQIINSVSKSLINFRNTRKTQQKVALSNLCSRSCSARIAQRCARQRWPRIRSIGVDSGRFLHFSFGPESKIFEKPDPHPSSLFNFSSSRSLRGPVVIFDCLDL